MLLAVLAIGVGVMMVKHPWSIDIEYWKECWNGWVRVKQNYVLSLSYMDQVSWATTRLRSLQCWAARLGTFAGVVEPFVNNVFLGVPLTRQAVAESSNLSFGDLFDLKTWNRIGGQQGFPPLASWEEFLAKAPRKVVLVQIVYEYDYHCPEDSQPVTTCNHTRLRTFFTEFLEPHLFSVHSEVCVDFNQHGFISRSEFNHLIFSGAFGSESVSLVFDEWRAMYPFVVIRDRDIKCFLQFKDVECSPLSTQMADTTALSLQPATNILVIAQKYISLHLKVSHGFVAVLVRWEKILLYHFYRLDRVKKLYTGNSCMKLIVEYLEEVRRTKGIDSVFFSTDVGRFGSSTFHMYNATRENLPGVTRYTEELIRHMYGTSMTLEQYEQTVVDVSGSTNPVLIAQVMKAVAANARCLLLVGSGLFHEHTLSMYKELHKGVDCYKIIEVC